MGSRIALLAAMAALASAAGWVAGVHVGGESRDSPLQAVEPAERRELRSGAGTDASTSVFHQTRPDFRLPDLEGRKRGPDEWAGRILILNFWATWCAPCREEIPMLIDLHRRRRPEVQVVGIAVDTADAVRGFASELGIEYPLVLDDLRGTVMRRYGNRLGALPYTVVVAKDGVVVYVRLGLLEAEELDGVVDALI